MIFCRIFCRRLNQVKVYKRIDNLLYAIGLVVLCFGISYWILYPSGTGKGDDFFLFTFFFIIQPFAFYFGTSVIALRLFRLLKTNDRFWYIFIGCVNLAFGLSAIILFAQDPSYKTWLNDCLLNLMAGALIISDVFVLGQPHPVPGSGS